MTHRIVEFASKELGVKLYPGQAEALSAYYESGAQNWLLLAGRRGGKSLLSDVVACYEALIPNLAEYTRPAEDRYIIVVSTRLDGARLHVRNIAKLIKHARGLGSMIVSQKEDEVRLRNNTVILSIPCSARAGRGYTASTILFDEMAHFVDSLGNSSADGVFNALAPTVATFGEAARIIITTTPSSRTGIVYDLYDRAKSGELPEFYVTKADTRTLNPKVSERTIASAYKRDPEAAATEYGAEFRDPLEAFFSSEAIDNVVDPLAQETLRAVPGVTYAMAIDPALMKDRYAFCVAHLLEGVCVLDYAFAMKPPVDPNAAEELLFTLAGRFKPERIYCDTAATTERLKGKLPALVYTPFTRPLKLKIYGSLKEAINLNKIVLYEHPELIAELKALQIRNGVDIAAPKSGKITHDDLADCLALVVDSLVGGQNTVGTMVPDPFEHWDDEQGMTSGGDWHLHHSPGAASWQDCKYRPRGCLECAQEWQDEPQYQHDTKRAADIMAGRVVAMSKADAEAERAARFSPAPLSTEEINASVMVNKLFTKFSRIADEKYPRRDHV